MRRPQDEHEGARARLDLRDDLVAADASEVGVPVSAVEAEYNGALLHTLPVRLQVGDDPFDKDVPTRLLEVDAEWRLN